MLNAPGDLVGAHFAGKFRVDALVHTDDRQALFVAVDTSLDRIVALKVVWSWGGDGQEAAQTLQREGLILARIEHRNTRRIYEAGRDQQTGVPYLALEWIPGQTLDALLRLPMTWTQFLRLARDLAAGLAAGHRQGIFHGGLNPRHVVITTRTDGQLCARLLEFGAANPEAYAISMSRPDLRTDQQTLAYLAPEQLRGEGTDLRTDVYAFGALLYQLATGKPPFTGSVRDIIKGHLEGRVRRPRPRAGLEMPLLLEALIRRCLEKEPAARFQDCRELQEIFTNLLREISDARQAVVNAVTVDPLARYVVVGRLSGRVDVYGVDSGALVTSFEAHQGAVTALRFRPKSDEFLSAGEDGHIHLWSVGERRLRNTWPGMRGDLYALAFSPFGYIFASGEIDGRVRLWSLVEEGALGEFQAHAGPVTALHFLPEGRFLASGGRDGAIHLWDIGNMVHAETCQWVRGSVTNLMMRVRERFVAVFEDGSMAMGRWTRDEPQWHNRLHRHRVSAVFEQDGGQGVISTGLDGVVNSVDQFDGDLRRPPLWHLEGVRAAVLHPRTEQMFCASDSMLLRWRWVSGRDEALLEGFLVSDGEGWQQVGDAA